ncbi:hypothetical protein KL905_001272 [Ogataea polymorpha]|nr:hypothetical protein KL937_002662 [Ogataea polymorpha]KAG7896865.1 hypothetical protein KL908_000267 [Ogataea polymorpha]KAG7912064.1 hypothetical protein KL906_000268 [Ogataea polymorpha]KAG7913364.1 hypothetical protein KL907_000309 [Ogataea polymorpha]KAG7923006.1 hypothetical protein KL905_001272 [Ogataea polymorpha]
MTTELLSDHPSVSSSVSQVTPVQRPTTSTSLDNRYSFPASAIEGGRELSRTVLHVGGLPKSVTKTTLRELFLPIGSPILTIKLFSDKNKSEFHYSFIEFGSHSSAESVFKSFNGTLVAGCPIKVSWAFQTQRSKSNNLHNLYVGDLSPDVNDETLGRFFNNYRSFVQANVMWDMKTGKSRGYGFVSFQDFQDAQKCLYEMNGVMLGGWPIKINTASRKTDHYQTSSHYRLSMHSDFSTIQSHPLDIPSISPAQLYHIIYHQTPSWNNTIYLGNLVGYVTQERLISLLQKFGYIIDFKLCSERRCAFIKFDRHEHAVEAILRLNGMVINGTRLKCNWGKQHGLIARANHD